MNANEIILENMTIDEKLKAIADALETAQSEHQNKYPGEAPLDPASLTICDGCS